MHRHSTTFWLAAVPGFAVVCLGTLVLTQEPAGPNAAQLKNPVAATPQSLADGKKAYDENCAACHGPKAEGSVKAGVIISIIQEQGGKQPPDLTDAQWDHGSTDGEIYTAIRKGVPPT
ncbi:MAG: c-type cytochrome, partial [Vicinamibacteria bacterium]